jgi:hypothetical protein
MACCVPPRLLSRTLVFALVGLSFAPSDFAGETHSSPANSEILREAPALFQRVVLLGASVTAGFDMTEPLGGPKSLQYRFANFVDAALADMHQPVQTQASSLLFFKPEQIMEQQIAAVVAAKPSLVIGVDALFWFCYGPRMTPEQRLTRFEAGLSLLERIAAPLVVGDIPDASEAVGGMLSPDEMPDPRVLVKCNESLKAWAAARQNVAIIPLSRLMAAAFANTEITLGGTRWPKGKSGSLVRSDHLHPSRHGLAALAIEALDAAATVSTSPPARESICRELETVYTRALAKAAAAAEQQVK